MRDEELVLFAPLVERLEVDDRVAIEHRVAGTNAAPARVAPSVVMSNDVPGVVWTENPDLGSRTRRPSPI